MPLLSVHNWDSPAVVSIMNYDTFKYMLGTFCTLSLLYSGAFAVSTGAFGDDMASTLVRSVICAGNESGLLDCSYHPGTCTEHSAAVICQSEMLTQVLIIYTLNYVLLDSIY